MKSGIQVMFQNLDRGRAGDTAVVEADLALVDLAADLGFESMWDTEHHFAGYSMIPNTLMLLSYLAGRHPDLEIGSSVVVLPWHHPVRVAGEVALLDNLCGGRFLLGIGRGLGRNEFEGYGIPMEESRARFIEGAEIILDGLDKGYVEYEGTHFSVPRREIRPAPTAPFRPRTFAAAGSPESSEIMAKLGVGLLVNPQGSWEQLRHDIDVYRGHFERIHGAAAPPTVYNPKVMCDIDGDRARELAQQYLRRYFNGVMDFYEMTSGHFAKTKGYESYAPTEDGSEAEVREKMTEGFLSVQVVGSPDECLEQIREAQKFADVDHFVGLFSFGDMPLEIAENNVRTFAEHVMPELGSMSVAQPA
jgi:alkanesulfonate monooxygenase SsuD/methylene tetrahydromethanopterin reductase-like flavin-dependent oxidoreductase (luciferase family)